MEAVIQLLDSIFPLSSAAKDHFASIVRHQIFPKKAFLLKAGQVCEKIYFINNGLTRCFYHDDDQQEVSAWFMKEGDIIISVESFYQQKKSFESIQALEDCDVYWITFSELQDMFIHYPEFNFVSRVLTERYYTLSEQRLYSLRMHRAPERYAYLVKNHAELIQRVPLKYLASYLGITEETLSRIRSKRLNY